MVDELEGPSSFTQEEPHIWAACREAWAYIRRSKWGAEGLRTFLDLPKR